MQSTKSRLVVVGSANQDLIVKAERIPAPGETILGGAFVTAPGGKGANQAVAASRLGADVWFVGRVGSDTFGATLADALTSSGVHVDYLRRDPAEPTGIALIAVDADGQNAIVVAAGANLLVGPVDLEAARSAIETAFAVVVQLEIPLETVEAAIALARSSNARVVLNPAPAPNFGEFPDHLLSRIDVLTPNEHEAARILGHSSPSGLLWTDAAERLRDKGVETVVITLGDAGCILADRTGTRHVPAPVVQAVDTTGAGDCFTAALSVALAEGRSLDDAALFASHAAALSVTRMGAQPSFPSRDEVARFLTSSSSI